MPEGDTIHRVAARLAPAITGKPLRRLEIARYAGPLPVPGTLVDGVRVHGKHLLIDFADGATLRVHLRMTGSWHLYRPNEAWGRRAGAARVVLEVDDWVAVCFSAPDVEVVPTASATPGHLGPDLLGGDLDIDQVLGRFGSIVEPDTPIGVALLDQRVAAGIGNVYKCELCHLAGLHPHTRATDVDEQTRRRLYAEARRLLAANLGHGERRTVPEGLAVYGRAGRDCRRCGTTIVRAITPADGRVTYWCPGCQLDPAGPR